MNRVAAVLDASALLALLNGEPGAEVVAQTIPGAHISAVNVEEVTGKLALRGMPAPMIEEALAALGLAIHPFTADLARISGLSRPITDRCGLSLADRTCLALARHLDLPAYTAERSWKEVASDLGVQVLVIRGAG